MLSGCLADHAWPGTIPAFVEAVAKGRYVMPDLVRHSLARTIQTLLFSWRGGRLKMSGGTVGKDRAKPLSSWPRQGWHFQTRARRQPRDTPTCAAAMVFEDRQEPLSYERRQLTGLRPSNGRPYAHPDGLAQARRSRRLAEHPPALARGPY